MTDVCLYSYFPKNETQHAVIYISSYYYRKHLLSTLGAFASENTAFDGICSQHWEYLLPKYCFLKHLLSALGVFASKALPSKASTLNTGSICSENTAFDGICSQHWEHLLPKYCFLKHLLSALGVFASKALPSKASTLNTGSICSENTAFDGICSQHWDHCAS